MRDEKFSNHVPICIILTFQKYWDRGGKQCLMQKSSHIMRSNLGFQNSTWNNILIIDIDHALSERAWLMGKKVRITEYKTIMKGGSKSSNPQDTSGDSSADHFEADGGSSPSLPTCDTAQTESSPSNFEHNAGTLPKSLLFSPLYSGDFMKSAPEQFGKCSDTAFNGLHSQAAAAWLQAAASSGNPTWSAALLADLANNQFQKNHSSQTPMNTVTE